MCACTVAVLAMAGPARAAPARVHFKIAPEAYSEALIDLALQADVTLLGAAACQGGSVGLIGSYTVEEALGSLLAKAPCTWRMVAVGSVEILPLPRQSQPEPPAAIPVVSQLLVTATKRVQTPRQLAVSITAISGEQLHATGAVDPGDTPGQLAGVLATNLGPGRDKLLFRGLSDGAFTGRARSTVGTYLDDTPINYNAPDPDLRLVDVERVEVVRGPQGALYGGGSLSGVYRIVTRKPDLGRRSADLRASVSATEGGAPSQSLEGYVNLPLLRGVLAVRVSGYNEIQGGYLDDLNLGRKNVDKTQRAGGRISLAYQPTSTWTFNLTALAQHLRSDDTHYTTPGLGLERTNRIAEPHVNDLSLVTATVHGSWGWGELTSSTGYIRHAYSSIYDATAVQDLYTSFAVTSVYADATQTKMLVQDLVLTSRGASRWHWLAGLYASNTDEASPTQFLIQPIVGPLAPVYSDVRSDRIRELAAYGELSYEVAPGWVAAVGGRAFRIQAHTRSYVQSERFDPRTIDRTVRFAGVSPKISLQHEFGSGSLIYAVASEGYRAGGINSGGARPLSAIRESFAPDRLANYEIGLKLVDRDRRLSLNSALFYDVWTNIQTDQFRPSGIPYTTNVGDAGIAGIEAELAYAWTNGLSLQANGRLSRTHITRVNPDYAAQLTDGLPDAPVLSGGFLASYQRVVLRDKSLRLSGELSYVGPSRVTFDPTLASKMPGYFRARLSAGLSGRGWDAQVFITNPMNAYSDTFSYGNPFTFAQARQITPQRPRTVGMTVSAPF